MKRGKRGQVSIFIIIALVIVVGVAIALLVSKNYFNVFSSDVNVVKNAVSSCMDNSAKEAIDTIGIQGGFNKKPDYSFESNYTLQKGFFIPYYFYEGKLLMPSNSVIENNIAEVYDSYLVSCINNLSLNEYSVSFGEPKTKVKIAKKYVYFNSDLRVDIKKDDKITELELNRLPVTTEVLLYEALEVSRYISDSHRENSERICVTCVADMASERGLFVNSFDAPNYTVWFVVHDNNYYYQFMNKYKAPEVVEGTE